MQTNRKRILSLLPAVVLIVGVLAVPVSADGLASGKATLTADAVYTWLTNNHPKGGTKEATTTATGIPVHIRFPVVIPMKSGATILPSPMMMRATRCLKSMPRLMAPLRTPTGKHLASRMFLRAM